MISRSCILLQVLEKSYYYYQKRNEWKLYEKKAQKIKPKSRIIVQTDVDSDVRAGLFILLKVSVSVEVFTQVCLVCTVKLYLLSYTQKFRMDPCKLVQMIKFITVASVYLDWKKHKSTSTHSMHQSEVLTLSGLSVPYFGYSPEVVLDCQGIT